MVVNIKITGIRRAIRAFGSLAKGMPITREKITMGLAKSLKKGMKMRAPKATGFLKDSIHIVKGAKGIATVVVGAPYASAQEYGFSPHSIPIQYMEMHYSTPGARGQPISRSEISGWAIPTKFTPFARPATESLRKRAVPIAEKIIALEITKAGFK